MGIPSTDYAAGIATLKRFVSTSCIPSETTYDEHVAQFHGADRWSFECVPPVLEHLKSEAKTLGLWNLFAPLSFRRQFNSSTSTPPPPNSLQTIPLSVKQYAEISLILGSSTLAPEACNCSAPDTGNMEVLMHYGDDAQKQKYLPKLLEGKCRSAFLMTEPKVGSSDAMNIETKIEKRGNEYVINGLKWWSSGAQDPRCEVFVLMGRIVVDSNIKSTEQRSHSLHTMIIVPRHLPGVEMVRPCTVFGADDAPHGHAMVRLTNVRVKQSEAILLGEGRGFEIAQGRLGPGRVHHCMRAIGCAQRAYEMMITRAGSRVTFGSSLLSKDLVRAMISESFADLEAARLITEECARRIDEFGAKGARTYIQMIKYEVPARCLNVVDRAIQVWGGGGVDNMFLVKSFAYMRCLRIADGPDEVHRISVGVSEGRRVLRDSRL
ncbi:hypothetical protein ScalyP_jg7571 [Parmales sp. scaly parma]|nr:hypothetical protein ScalyP_jg7571 [Parmales sp. scaly parma]